MLLIVPLHLFYALPEVEFGLSVWEGSSSSKEVLTIINIITISTIMIITPSIGTRIGYIGYMVVFQNVGTSIHTPYAIMLCMRTAVRTPYFGKPPHENCTRNKISLLIAVDFEKLPDARCSRTFRFFI